jgi:probable phosphoglycerate mutase
MGSIWQTVASGLMTSRVLLVRHGQSEWNALGRWQGQADPPLSDLGREQARSAARSLGALDAVYASDLQRATETAVIIAGQLGVGPVILDADLRERDAGEWSGLTREEIHERYPGYLPEDRHRAFAPDGGAPKRPPGWEADDHLLERVLLALGRIHEAVPDGDVLAVTHGGVIYVLDDHLGAPFHRLANGEGRWVEIDENGQLRLGERVLLVNDDGTTVTVPDQL